MSPRSSELRDAAHRRLAAARIAVAADPATAVSAAYYAMLYGARAALSERDVGPRTHRGTWLAFRRVFVDTGVLAADLLADAQRAQPEREHADYDAWSASPEDADRVIAAAERFLAAIDALGL